MWKSLIPTGMFNDKFIRNNRSSYPSDNAFGVIGNGLIPSISIGRITGNKNADADDPKVLKYIAWKIIHHESNPTEGEWLSKCLLWGVHSYAGGQTDGLGLKIKNEWSEYISPDMTITKGTDYAGAGGEKMNPNQVMEQI